MAEQVARTEPSSLWAGITMLKKGAGGWAVSSVMGNNFKIKRQINGLYNKKRTLSVIF
jgi:hypothetical protein